MLPTASISPPRDRTPKQLKDANAAREAALWRRRQPPSAPCAAHVYYRSCHSRHGPRRPPARLRWWPLRPLGPLSRSRRTPRPARGAARAGARGGGVSLHTGRYTFHCETIFHIIQALKSHTVHARRAALCGPVHTGPAREPPDPPESPDYTRGERESTPPKPPPKSAKSPMPIE